MASPQKQTEDPSAETAEPHDAHYIQATAERIDDRTRVLKHGESFAVFDRFGDLQPSGLGEQGLFHEGTRFLSRLEVRLGGRRPMLLSSTVKRENDVLAVDLTNLDVTDGHGEIVLARGLLHLARDAFLCDGTCYLRLRVSSYALHAVETELVMRFDADYADIFEVRGMKRERRGRRLPELVEGDAITLGYEGLDGIVRRTRLAWNPAPRALSTREARFTLQLAPHETVSMHLTIASQVGSEPRTVRTHHDGYRLLQAELGRSHLARCRLRSSNGDLDEWMARSASDLHMMITETPFGPYPYAGVPWFSTPFGRDGIITALQILWLSPDIAGGVLRFLAATQATAVIPEQDAEPGKILHEARGGEMAALGEVPFGRYYGSVDATPLFVILAHATWIRTGDQGLLHAMAAPVTRALTWLRTYGDPDGDGFVEYARRSSTGLVQQGWKDSQDSVFHDDGVLAEAPIALAEVQGYAYAAWLAGAEIAEAMGDAAAAVEYRERAQALRVQFQQRFWSEEIGSYVLALDGAKRPCRVRASNAGHTLWSGIASPEHARRIADGMMSEDLFSGWGVRTLSARERRYNPMSYHNGSVWPHDNALIAAGLARYGLRPAALQILESLLGASVFVDLRRMPELFCGFARRPGEGPTAYPVACAPQAWAAGAVFQLVQAALGLTIDGRKNEIALLRPALPASVPDLRILGLRVGDATLDLLLENHDHDLGLTVLRREGDVRLVMVK
ncbi:MAG TPA: amylo-alpha-1,6-glucosidase [Polyangia bacterium]|nr:amylo-alpha-1,6-glucosidase [Polyangia bacterium]